MRKFETGKRYFDGAVAYEIIARTATTATLNKIYHAGKFNEKVVDTIKTKIQVWNGNEVICRRTITLDA